MPSEPPGYPQKMKGMTMGPETMEAVWGRREVKGMRSDYAMSVGGLMTVLRVLPEDLYAEVMESGDPIEKGAVFAEIVRRFGDPSKYVPAPAMNMGGGMPPTGAGMNGGRMRMDRP